MIGYSIYPQTFVYSTRLRRISTPRVAQLPLLFLLPLSIFLSVSVSRSHDDYIYSTIIMASASLSISSAFLSPPSFCTATCTSTSSSYSPTYAAATIRVSCLPRSRRKSLGQIYRKTGRLCQFEVLKCKEVHQFAILAKKDMAITEVTEEERGYSPLLDSESNSRPRRIALFVEPSPFS